MVSKVVAKVLLSGSYVISVGCAGISDGCYVVVKVSAMVARMLLSGSHVTSGGCYGISGGC